MRISFGALPAALTSSSRRLLSQAAESAPAYKAAQQAQRDPDATLQYLRRHLLVCHCSCFACFAEESGLSVCYSVLPVDSGSYCIFSLQTAVRLKAANAVSSMAMYCD